MPAFINIATAWHAVLGSKTQWAVVGAGGQPAKLLFSTWSHGTTFSGLRFLDGFLMVSWWFLDGFLMVSWWFLDGFLMFAVPNIMPNEFSRLYYNFTYFQTDPTSSSFLPYSMSADLELWYHGPQFVCLAKLHVCCGHRPFFLLKEAVHGFTRLSIYKMHQDATRCERCFHQSTWLSVNMTMSPSTTPDSSAPHSQHLVHQTTWAWAAPDWFKRFADWPQIAKKVCYGLPWIMKHLNLWVWFLSACFEKSKGLWSHALPPCWFEPWQGDESCSWAWYNVWNQARLRYSSTLSPIKIYCTT